LVLFCRIADELILLWLGFFPEEEIAAIKISNQSLYEIAGSGLEDSHISSRLQKADLPMNTSKSRRLYSPDALYFLLNWLEGVNP
jgi:hypothetical protein